MQPHQKSVHISLRKGSCTLNWKTLQRYANQKIFESIWTMLNTLGFLFQPGIKARYFVRYHHTFSNVINLHVHCRQKQRQLCEAQRERVALLQTSCPQSTQLLILSSHGSGLADTVVFGIEVEAAEKNVAVYLHICTNEVDAIGIFLFKQVHILIDWMVYCKYLVL